MEVFEPLEPCEHRFFRYPNPLPPSGKACRECGLAYRRPEWMKNFTESELDDYRVLLELQALLLLLGTGEISHREGVQRHRTLIELHQLAGREAYLVDLHQRVLAVQRG